jgi:hypothetical protein
MNHTLSGDWQTRNVRLDGNNLFPNRSQRIRNHSPDGFSWGYGGSGPAQLALAILLEIIPETEARMYYQEFKSKFVAALPRESFDNIVFDPLDYITEER